TTYPHCKDIITFFEAVQNDRKAKGLSCFNYDVAIKYLKLFALENEINFKGINREWLKRFREFLLSTPSLKNERTLSFNSASTYFSIVLSTINEAIQNRLLEPDVIKNLKPIKRGYLKTEALSAQELSRL